VEVSFRIFDWQRHYARTVAVCALAIGLGLVCGPRTCAKAVTPAAVAAAQSQVREKPSPTPPETAAGDQTPANGSTSTPEGERELQTAIGLTRRGSFADAIPHFLAARGHVKNEFAAEFNLALCYVGDAQFPAAIPVLKQLLAQGHASAQVYNLLAQAYVGDDESKEALETFQKSLALAPENEKLDLYVADACMDRQNYTLGLRVIDLALQHLPHSARLEYEGGVFLAALDRSDLATRDFELAIKLAPDSPIAYMAQAQEDYTQGDMPGVIRVARAAAKKDDANYILKDIWGEALLREGVTPDEEEFSEARRVLEESVAERPNYSPARIALGKLYLSENRFDDAIAQLEHARDLQPNNTAVYSHLAIAYRAKGRTEDSKKMLAVLARLNEEEAARIRSAPGDSKGSYVGSGRVPDLPDPSIPR
jgi:tetratricopeptide (TPR) repeat protein